jgi:hypothetical protein
MSVSQPANFNLQQFSDAGLLLLGGRLYTYAFGTVAQKTAFTDPAGAVPQTYTADGAGGQYIALNVRGELPAPLYLAPGAYDIALKRADGSTVWTRRADPVGEGMTALATPVGAAMIGGAGQVVATIAGLRALLKINPSKNAFVTGYWADGDGGGGQYRYDAADIVTADNGGTVIVAADGGRWKLVLLGSTVTVKQFGARGNFNRTTGAGNDDLPAFQAASNWCAANCTKLFVPQHAPLGGYLIRSTWDLTSTSTISRQGLVIEFENRSTEFQRGTLLCGETGDTPVVDTSGSDGTHPKNMGIVSGFANKSTIGFLQGRTAGTGSTGWAGDQSPQDLYVWLSSNTAANGGFGTIGIINVAGEETKWHNLQVWANSPLMVGSGRGFLATAANMDDGYKNFVAASPFVTLTDSGSDTVMVLSGFSRLIAYDYVSACVHIQEAGTVDLGTTFMQKRMSGVAGAVIGAHAHAIETWGVAQLKHFGSVEGCRAYLLIRRFLTTADLNVRMAESNIAHTYPMIMFWSDGGTYALSGVSVRVDAPGSLEATLTKLFGWRRVSTSGGLEPAPFTLDRIKFSCTLPWKNTMIDAGTLRNCTSGEFSFSDRVITYTDAGCFNTKIEKNIGNTAAAAVLLAKLQLPASIAGVSVLGATAVFDGMATNAVTNGVGMSSSARISMQLAISQDQAGAIFVAAPASQMLSNVSANPAGNLITGVTFTTSVDAATNLLSIFAHPVQTGANNADVLLKGKLQISSTPGYKNDVQFVAV